METWKSIINPYVRPDGEAPIHYVSLRIEQPARNLNAEVAAGQIPETSVPIPTGQAFRIASISKTLTATLVLQLCEEGKVSLSDKIADRLATVPYLDFDRLHRVDGQSFGRDITIEHLLRHTSGLADYLLDDPRFMDEVMADPTAQWSARRLMNRYDQYGLADKAKARPGERMHYSDTNYLLLALLVEQTIGKPLHQNLTERLFEPLGMENSWLEFYQPVRGSAPLVYPYQGRISTAGVNTSFDWGGGGIVSTHADLHRFLRGLLQGKVFRHPNTLTTMLDFQPEGNTRFTLGTPATEYGLGIRRLRIGSHTVLGHSGSWGCVMLYDPVQDVSLTVAVHQAEQSGQLGEIVKKALHALDNK